MSKFVGAVCNVLGYIVFAIPFFFAVFLFVLGIGSQGFWWGLIGGCGPIACVYLLIIGRIDWQNEVHKAEKRIREGRKKEPLTEESPLFSDKRDSKADLADAPKNYPNTMRMELLMNESFDSSMPMLHKLHLLFKRGATCLVVLGILAAGAGIRVFVPVPSQPLFSFVSMNTTNISLEYSTNTYVT